MGILTGEMKQVVEQQRLGFVATVCADGTPNVSPKGTICVLDDDRLMFADIHSPGTVANLRRNPSVEVNVVDAFVRRKPILEPGESISFWPTRNSLIAREDRELVTAALAPGGS